VRWIGFCAGAANTSGRSSGSVIVKSSADDGFLGDHSATARALLVRVLPGKFLVKDGGKR
jgi:hypothetical protein